MIKKINKTAESGTGSDNSVYRRKPGAYTGIFIGAVLTVLVMAAGFGSLKAHAETSGKKTNTVVIKTESDDEFARKSSELAKKSRGLTVQSTGEAKAYSSGRLIVSVNDGVSIDFSKYNAETVIESNFGICLVQFSSGSEAKKAAKKIADLPGVSYVEPDDCAVNIGETSVKDYSMDSSSAEETEIPSRDETAGAGELGNIQIGGRTYGDDEDTVFDTSVHAEGTVTSSNAMSWGASYIQADKYAAYVKENTKRSIKVAVVDSGVSWHTRLSGRILAGRDFVDNDSNPSDQNGHGTHVAGIIADCTPGINVKILPVRVMNASGSGSPSVLGNGIRYAVNQGAKVINLSLGSYRHYKYIEECITYAHNKGVTVVVAAGNDCDNTLYLCPAHMSTPIVVGAINSNGQRAAFSNYGSSLDITAPGVDIKSCWLNGGYVTASGTSMAVPHISAAAAMYRLMNPSATAARTEYLVRCYAKDLGSKGTDQYYGRGVPRMAGAITPSSVKLSKTSASLRVKKTMTLKATIAPSYAGMNKLTWTSSNDGIVSVSGGKLTALHEGEAVITVKTVNGKKAACKVTVSNATGELLNIGTLMKGPIATSIAQTLSIDKIVDQSSNSAKTSGSASSAQKAASASDTASASAQKDSAADTAAAQTTTADNTVDAAQEQEAVKIYVYPSEKAGNTPVQDGSIVAGSRLALETEIVPAQADGTVLKWESSNPDAAAVDENGIVTAVSAGEAQITAALSDGKNAGSYTVKVVKPSVLTRHASYKAGDDAENSIDAVLRLPASLSDDAEKEADRINPAADYVVALLNHEDGDNVLLGAFDLGAEDNGKIHVHDSETGGKRSDVTQVKGADEGILADMTSGKQASETGVLYMRSINPDGCKADLSLGVDVDALRALAAAGDARTETLSDCRLAVYTEEAFEEREAAVENKDTDRIREIDGEAICTCSFSFSYDLAAQEEKAAQEEAPAADTGAAAQPDTGTNTDEKDAGDTGNSADDNSGSTAAPAEDTSDNDQPAGDQNTEEETDSGQAASDSETADEAAEAADSGQEDADDEVILPQNEEPSKDSSSENASMENASMENASMENASMEDISSENNSSESVSAENTSSGNAFQSEESVVTESADTASAE